MYPERSQIIHLEEPLGEIANAVRERELATRRKLGDIIDEEEINEVAIQTCLNIARQALEEHLDEFPMVGPGGVQHLLVKQRHLHKKGIMFTVFVFSIILADMLGVEFVWSSDCESRPLQPATSSNSNPISLTRHLQADTMVCPESIEGTINTIAGDPDAGGASSGLVVHNASDNYVTRLASVVYWCELYLTRSLPGSMAVSDCQSGPSAAFRLSAIRPILVPWYNQRVFGKRMVSCPR